jgi:hypothetical protein
MAAVLLLSRGAFAQASTPLEEADRAFAEGRALLGRNAVAEACAQFAKSYELVPRPGTELNLAVCLEQMGTLPSAAAHFEHALGDARRDGRKDREDLATKHLAALQPKLAWLTFQVEGTAPNGLVVRVDGAKLPDSSAMNGSALPLLPGRHVVTADAPGRAPYRAELTLSAGSKQDFMLPALSQKSAAAPSTEPHQVTERAGLSAHEAQPSRPAAGRAREARALGEPDRQRVRDPSAVSIGLLSAGTISLAIGTVFGAKAMSAGSELSRTCPGQVCATGAQLERARQLLSQGKTDALVADIGLPVGVLLVAGGSLFWLTQRSETQAHDPTRSALAGLELWSNAKRGCVGASLGGNW